MVAGSKSTWPTLVAEVEAVEVEDMVAVEVDMVEVRAVMAEVAIAVATTAAAVTTNLVEVVADMVSPLVAMVNSKARTEVADLAAIKYLVLQRS